MNSNHCLPPFFAVLRTTMYGPPYFQFMSADYDTWQSGYNVEPVEVPYGYSIRLEPISPRVYQQQENKVFHIKIRNPDTNRMMPIYYWVLPFRINYHNALLLDFQYRSWYPSPSQDIQVDIPMSLGGLGEIVRISEVIQEKRIEDIRRMNIATPSYFDPLMSYHMQGPDDYDDRLYNQSNLVGPGRNRHRAPTPPPTPEVRIVQVEVERLVVKNPPLPKSVGDVLLSNARSGSDSCPIAATPFGECKKLSVTSCFHIFEYESLLKWQENHTTCPVCRAKIENVVSE